MKLGTGLVGMIALALLVAGCGQEAPPSPPKKPASKKVEAPMPKADAKPLPTEQQLEEAQPVFTYDPSMRRDPFVPLIEPKKPLANSDEPLTPLQQVELGQLRLVGVITGKGEPMAMVSAPGGKSYILRKGVKVGRNNGVVIGVDAGGVSVREKYYDFVGEVRENLQKINLPKREGAN
ncbi:pilus assembly protein PilP [Desulfuromonas acetexigens]|uniref:Pilus assembly protein PilP n=1 Tax=Trichloromonas acetexigens TaxID=38815 RepID=A0A550JLN5_9BACT|nr:pilus assembly protein PilP [Desulfuromonas acetexigens]TRO84119.1 pilus assembly protein PilP [Desulfuromonas acetexigens]